MFSSLDIGKVKKYMVIPYINLFSSRVQLYSSAFRVLLAASLINIFLENSFYININENVISYFNTRKLLFVILLPISCKKNEASLISFLEAVKGQVVARGRPG